VESIALLSPTQNSPESGKGILPFYLIEAIAICSDLVLIVTVSVVTGVAYHFLFLHSFGPVDSFLAQGALACIIFSSILAALGAYRPQILVNFWKQMRLSTLVWLFVFFVLSAVAFSFKISETFSRGATLTFFVVGWASIVIWRFILADRITLALAKGRFAKKKILLIAEQGQLKESRIVEDLKRCGYLPVRTFEFARSSIALESVSSWLLSSMGEIISITREEKIECAFLLMSWDGRGLIEQLMEQLRVLSLPVYLLPDSNVSHFLGSRIANIGTTWTAELKRAPLTLVEQLFKRLLDLVAGSLALFTLAPLMLLVAAVLKMQGRGPVFFVQTRNGFGGRPFRMYKFRTMSVLEDGPVIRQATKNDPRITRFGRLLRRTNIDELPQLFNVIAGHMSLVGPRPHAAAHNSEYEKTVANYAYRYHVKPGLTGWAQVHGLRGETQALSLMAKRIELDLWYINNWSFWLDLKILLRTLAMGLQSTAY
jgi:undecaprenyl-phosphate galactose phosphotransferase/putative colanic acid biosynthesis UDP-glucose lipid carrier transferase